MQKRRGCEGKGAVTEAHKAVWRPPPRGGQCGGLGPPASPELPTRPDTGLNLQQKQGTFFLSPLLLLESEKMIIRWSGDRH